MTVNESLRKYWEERHIANPQLPTPDDIKAFEAQHGVQLPLLIADYFLTVNGTKEGQWAMEDEDLISFWHLDQIQTLKGLSPECITRDAGSLFVFADWSVDAHSWAFRLSDDATAPTPIVITYEPPQQIAGTFEEFIDGYLRRERWALFPEPGQTRFTGRQDSR